VLFNFIAERVKFLDWRLSCFIGAFFLYALWGSPTPNSPDWVEGAIAILLFLAVGWQSILRNILFSDSQNIERWRLAAKIFLLYGFTVPLIVGVLQGTPITVIARDLIAFVFVCLPLFLYDFINGKKRREEIFIGCCLMIGLLFAIRVLVPHFLLFRNTTELLYLANSPLVLMSALLLGGVAGFRIFERINFDQFLKFLVLAGLCALPIMAMFVDLQRASFAALVVSVVSLGLIGFIKAPLKMIMPVLLMGSAFFIFESYFTGLLEGVGVKTSQVGLNMRLQELQAVWKVVSETPISILFGQGWGSHFASPAVGELNITYTHSLLSYLFLKTGITGLFLCLVYLYFIFEKLAILYCSDPVKGNALIWPFIIPIFLYASHKSFDYGVLLSLIALSTVVRGRVTA
jgi:hypothetical protein